VDGASDVLREYLGHRFGFNGLESTTDEVVARLRNERLGAISHNEITALLGDADLVKFAKAEPDEAQCDRMIEGAERIVLGTVPVSTAIAPPAPRRIDQTPARRKSKAPASDAPAATTGAVPVPVPAPTPEPAPAPETGSESASAEQPPASTSSTSPSPSSSSPTATTTTTTSTTSDTASPSDTLPEGEVDHLGRRIPDTNPPPPPDPAKAVPVTAPGTVAPKQSTTLIGGIDPAAPASTTLPDAAPSRPSDPSERKTPVGHVDPKDGGDR
jgi:hypothetical protein